MHYKGNSIFAPRFALIRQSFTVGPPLASDRLNFCLIFQVGDSPKFFSPMQYYADSPKFYAANVSRYTVVNTTSIPIGVAGEFRHKNFLWPNGFNSGCFQLHTSQNVATSIPSLTSQSCSDSMPSVCLAGQVGVINRPPEHPWNSLRSTVTGAITLSSFRTCYLTS